MHSSHHLVLRNDIYHFRFTLPKSLQKVLGKKEVHHTLKTKKRRLAIPRARALHTIYMEKKNKEEDASLKNIYLQLANGTSINIRHDDPEEERKSLKTVLEASGSSQVQVCETKTQVDLSEQMKLYLNDTAPDVTHRTLTEKQGAFEVFQKIVGTNLQLSHEAANLFSDTLKALPPNFTKKYPDEKLIDLALKKHEKTLSRSTFNKYIGYLSSFNNWLIKRGHADKNFFQGLNMKKTKQSHEERSPFTPQEIEKIFTTSDDFSGSKRWLPRLAFYTGCRLNELCQLYKDDVVESDGIWCLNITDGRGDQHLKNLSSKRKIPLHPAIRGEFLQYVEKVSGDRIFPELTFTTGSNYGGSASKWFTRFRKSIEIEGKFHSFRHTFASLLQEQTVEPKVIAALLGHSDSSETSRYTGTYSVSILLDAVCKLK